MTNDNRALRVTTMVLALLSATGAAARQEPTPPATPRAAETDDTATSRQARAAAQIGQVYARLGLTEEQQAQVEPVLRAGFERRLAILQKYGLVDANGRRTGDRPGMRDARRMKRDLDAAQDDLVERLKPLLTTAQLDQYERLQRELRDAARDRIR